MPASEAHRRVFDRLVRADHRARHSGRHLWRARPRTTSLIDPGFYVLEIVVMAGYFAVMHASSSQATLGKMAVGIKVTDEDGQRIGIVRGIGRFFATFVSSLILLVGYLMAAFTDRKRALHDMIASTLVVDRWAYTSHPERQRTSSGTVTIVILVIGGLLILAYLALIMLAVGLAAAAGAR